MSKRGGKYPGVSASTLRARFKSKNLEKEWSTSKLDKVGLESEVNQPCRGRRKVIVKKRKLSTIDVEDSDDLSEGDKGVPLEELPRFVENKKHFHGFTEGGEGSSLWSKDGTYIFITDDIGQSDANKAVVEEAGDIAIDQFMQVVGLRIASLRRSQEIRHRKSLLLFEEANKFNEELGTKKKVIDELEEKVSEKEKELCTMKEKYENESELLKKKNAELASLQEQIMEVSVKMKDLKKSK
ncbi:uncharacterized protein LOC110279243 [Arachis duranensis]|uniref:Uncharacterized protein LOC110279243 n=1 Tax=Arachis duranensis TaxID=130453 RepID=A0A6P5NDD3_ARADU|nr:uncharacterized protein LOC110279243 [Arachis duranensis]